MVFPTQPFYFIRHGETDWNRQHRAMGKQDIPLNETGVQQAREAVPLLKGHTIASIAVSPLARAKKTAEIIADSFHVPMTVIEDLQEADWGTMEGKPKGDGAEVMAWRKGHEIEGAEPFAEFSKRVMQGLYAACALPGPVLVVSHGGCYWAIQEALALPFMDLPNGVPVYHSPPSAPGEPWFVCALESPV